MIELVFWLHQLEGPDLSVSASSRTTNRRGYGATGLVFFAVATASMMIGCGRPGAVETSASLVSSKSNSESREPIYLGVVLRGTPTRICFPLSEFKFPNHRKLVAVETSCECVTTRLLTYRTPGGETDDAVLIEVIHDDLAVVDDALSAEPEPPANLVVTRTFRFGSGASAERQLRFLCSDREAVPR